MATAASSSDVRLSSAFDGGNGALVSVEDGVINVSIEKDPPTAREGDVAHSQWFYFRLSNISASARMTVRLTNAGEASYARGWEGYQCCASYDRRKWFRVADTSYDDGVLSVVLPPDREARTIYLSYFAPYSTDRHLEFVAECASRVDRCAHEEIGQTLDGAPLDLLRFFAPGTAGDEGDKPKVWVIARQHPGETMASFFMEGLLRRLLDKDDPVAREVLRQCDVYAIPLMCPDGARRGHLRTNAVGVNLNREWGAGTTSVDRCPEVFHTLEKMDSTGLHLLLDVHGDEALPYNFISGGEGVPCWNRRHETNQMRFQTALCNASPDFQTKHGYGRDAPNSANLDVGSNGVMQRFDALGMTLEMPFKDTIDSPQPEEGWSPARSAKLGAASLDAILSVAPFLLVARD